MAGSYQKIDYRIRPAKSIERKMLVEAFQKLADFGRLENYRYIGFGSLYFTDFILFHKQCGFKSMISIEMETDVKKQSRFNYNIPYNKVIQLHFGASNAVLPTLPWDVRSIIWLDYDGPVNESVLNDIAYVLSKAVSGSMLLISANAASYKTENQSALEALTSNITPERIPVGLAPKDLAGWGMAKTLRDIIDNHIADTLVTVNAGKSQGAQMRYRQLFNFEYEDGAKMLTVGGVIFDEGHENTLAKCGFANLNFYRDGNTAYRIEMPLLTQREIQRLDSMIPLSEDERSSVPVPPSDIQKYEAIYRYFPHFAETELR